MQLIKRSQKNQVVIPKMILDQAGVTPNDTYLKIDYNKKLGVIILQPVSIEDKIPADAIERFEATVIKGQPGDHHFPDIEAALKHLHSSRKAHR